MQLPPLDQTTSASFASRVAAAALDAYESHAVFRCLLDAFARPGTLQQLPEVLAQRLPSALLPVVALADVDVPVAVCEPVTADGGTPWAAVVAAATGAPLVAVDAARMVATLEPLTMSLLHRLQPGSAHSPEPGTRIVATCSSIHLDHPATASGSSVFLVHGPGVAETRSLAVGGVPSDAIAALAEINRRRPAGIDTWFVTPTGRVLGLPRSTRIEPLDRGYEDGH